MKVSLTGVIREWCHVRPCLWFGVKISSLRGSHVFIVKNRDCVDGTYILTPKCVKIKCQKESRIIRGARKCCVEISMENGIGFWTFSSKLVKLNLHQFTSRNSSENWIRVIFGPFDCFTTFMMHQQHAIFYWRNKNTTGKLFKINFCTIKKHLAFIETTYRYRVKCFIWAVNFFY